MRRIKKAISMVILAAMMLNVSACGSKSDKDLDTTITTEMTQTTETGGTATTEDKKSTDDATTDEPTTEVGTTEETPTTEVTDATTTGEVVDVPHKEYLAENLLDNVTAGKVKQKELDKKFKKSVAEFAINMFKTSARDDLKDGKNVMISPDSIMTCLAMTANGAKGNTLSEMENVICPGLKLKDFNEYLFTYNENKKNSKEVKINCANSIWIRNDEERIKINDGYLGKTKTYYDAAVYKADFTDQTADSINSWVKKETNDMIDKIIDRVDESTVMYLINAIAFEGEWAEQYEDYQVYENEKFTDSKGKKQKVNMLKSTEGHYMKNDECQAFLKYYKGYDYAFMGILPNEDVNINDFVESLDGEKFMKLYSNPIYNADVIASIPEFSYDYDTVLNNPLYEMGMKQAFDETADFSDMASTKTGDLFIDIVLHKTHIELDRNGTKAAAVTAVAMEDCAEAMPVERLLVEITLDRPFVYAIVDTSTGIPMFIGAVNSVK